MEDNQKFKSMVAGAKVANPSDAKSGSNTKEQCSWIKAMLRKEFTDLSKEKQAQWALKAQQAQQRQQAPSQASASVPASASADVQASAGAAAEDEMSDAVAFTALSSYGGRKNRLVSFNTAWNAAAG